MPSADAHTETSNKVRAASARPVLPPHHHALGSQADIALLPSPRPQQVLTRARQMSQCSQSHEGFQYLLDAGLLSSQVMQITGGDTAPVSYNTSDRGAPGFRSRPDIGFGSRAAAGAVSYHDYGRCAVMVAMEVQPPLSPRAYQELLRHPSSSSAFLCCSGTDSTAHSRNSGAQQGDATTLQSWQHAEDGRATMTVVLSSDGSHLNPTFTASS